MALGVVVTALVQAVLGGIGLAVSGVPYATLLTVLIHPCLVQLGPLPVLIGDYLALLDRRYHLGNGIVSVGAVWSARWITSSAEMLRLQRVPIYR